MAGHEIDSLDVGQLAANIGDVDVFYRANPKHKLKIVKVNHHLLSCCRTQSVITKKFVKAISSLCRSLQSYCFDSKFVREGF